MATKTRRVLQVSVAAIAAMLTGGVHAYRVTAEAVPDQAEPLAVSLRQNQVLITLESAEWPEADGFLVPQVERIELPDLDEMQRLQEQAGLAGEACVKLEELAKDLAAQQELAEKLKTDLADAVSERDARRDETAQQAVRLNELLAEQAQLQQRIVELEQQARPAPPPEPATPPPSASPAAEEKPKQRKAG